MASSLRRMSTAAEDRAPVMNSFKNKLPIGSGENQVSTVDFRHPNMGLTKKLELPQLARFMDGTVLHSGFLAFKVSRDSPHRILPRYIVLRGRPASIHTFRPDTDPSNYAPHAKRIDISMITSVELGIGEDKYPESKVFKNWQNTILKNNFCCGNGKVPASHCLTIHGVQHESKIDSPFEKEFTKGKKHNHLFLETMDLIMDSAETRDLFANAIVMYILTVRPQGVHIDPMKQDIPNQLSKADQEMTAERCQDHLDWVQFQSEDKQAEIKRAKSKFRNSIFGVASKDRDLLGGAATPTPAVGKNWGWGSPLSRDMDDIKIEDDGRATPSMGSSRRSGSWSLGFSSPRSSRSRSRSRDPSSPDDGGGIFGWLWGGGGGGDTERRSSRALEEGSEREDDTGREDGGGVEGEVEGEGESKGDDRPSGGGALVTKKSGGGILKKKETLAGGGQEVALGAGDRLDSYLPPLPALGAEDGEDEKKAPKKGLMARFASSRLRSNGKKDLSTNSTAVTAKEKQSIML